MEPLELQERRKKVRLRSHIYLSALFNSAVQASRLLVCKLTRTSGGLGSVLILVVFSYCQE